MKKRRTILSLLALLAVALLLREWGKVDFSLYRSNGGTSSREQAAAGLQGVPLTKEEVVKQAQWPSVALGRFRIYYTETCVRPWTRWFPLVKFGNTQISREYFVIAPEGKVLWGKTEANVSLTAVGSLSARKFSEVAEGGDRKTFLKSVEAKLAATPSLLDRPLLAPLAPAVDRDR